MKIYPLWEPLLAVALTAIFSTAGCQSGPEATDAALVGAWRGQVQFTTGAFAGVKDLDFMYVFHADGTLTESSNYDASPPVPPAYGVWRKIGARLFEARYEYYWTKAPANFAAIAQGGGWAPGGRGVLSQQITLAADGQAFTSTIKYEVLDPQGRPTEAASAATGQGERLRF